MLASVVCAVKTAVAAVVDRPWNHETHQQSCDPLVCATLCLRVASAVHFCSTRIIVHVNFFDLRVELSPL